MSNLVKSQGNARLDSLEKEGREINCDFEQSLRLAKANKAKGTRLLAIIYSAKALRTFAFGSVAVILAIYLRACQFSHFEIGALLSATLIEDAIVTTLLALLATKYGAKNILLFSGLLLALSGLILAGTDNKALIALAIIAGTISPAGFEGGAFSALEQSLLAESSEELVRKNESSHAEELTRILSIYNLCGFGGAALGSLIAGLCLTNGGDGATRILLASYFGIGLTLSLLYTQMKTSPRSSKSKNPENTDSTQNTEKIANTSPRLGKCTLSALKNRHISWLAGLQSLDAFGGGFVVQSLLSAWFITKYGCKADFVGLIFCLTNLLGAVSFLMAPYLAKRFGLLSTMVFTHLPCSFALCLMPFMPSAGAAGALLVVRSLFSSMDIPARQAFSMILVKPEERPYAASLTASARALAQGLAPLVAGLSVSSMSAGLPLILGGALKCIYDLTLWFRFKDVRPHS
ncbi:MAG: MFS transporter [Candidatus Obscuribacter phosphatis]|uniref:MFS transporter n=1 Tax=Candidatus Obscuribacter phosphatis TaxID=1906157 RepID=A0A8J7PF68_9BACT|nr:MFS transporter [Candidatus Obscuribacter phosphatis]